MLTGAHCPAFEEVSAVCSMEGMWRAAGWRAVSPRGPLQRYGFVQRTFCHRVEHNLSIQSIKHRASLSHSNIQLVSVVNVDVEAQVTVPALHVTVLQRWSARYS